MNTSKIRLVRQLLNYTAGHRFGLSGAHGVNPSDDGQLSAEVQWVIDGGLGPLLHRAACEEGIEPPLAAWRDRLLASDLTARVRHGCLVAATIDVLATCKQLGVSPTLLKGISTSDELYPEGHLRPMGDVDILIPEEASTGVESALVRRGYVRCEGASLHHGPPLRHPEWDVWVELHTDLCSSDSHLHDGKTFARARVAEESLASSFQGASVNRLQAELQLSYIATSWMADIARFKVHPSYIAPLIDVIYLLRANDNKFDWDRLATGLDNPLARAWTYVTVAYLARRGLARVPRSALSQLAAGQSIVGAVQTASVHAMLDRYLVAGRRWNLPFPPPVPGRYGIRFQFEKRILRRYTMART